MLFHPNSTLFTLTHSNPTADIDIGGGAQLLQHEVTKSTAQMELFYREVTECTHLK